MQGTGKRFKATKIPTGNLSIIFETQMSPEQAQQRKEILMAATTNYQRQIEQITELKALAQEELSELLIALGDNKTMSSQ